MLTHWKESYDQPRQHIKKQRHYFANEGPSDQGYGFPSGHVWMWELDCEENWAPKNCCFWTVVLEKTLESPLDCKEIQPVHPKGWVFIGRTDAETETPVLWPPHAKSWLIGKDPEAGRDWGKEGKAEDEMAGWRHQLDGHEFQWTPGVGDGQGGLACCDSWGRKESDTTERLNWTEHAHTHTQGCTHAYVDMTCIFMHLNVLRYRVWVKVLTVVISQWFYFLICVFQMVCNAHEFGWHHQLNGPESEQILGDSEGQGSQSCWSPWGHKESDTT